MLLEHAGQFLLKRVTHCECFLQAGRCVACRQRREKAKQRQSDLVLALEVRVEHRREFLRGSADSPGSPRRFRQCLVYLLMFGLQ